jgi:hypothetical protein
MYVAAAAVILSILLAFVALLGQDLSLGVHARGVVRRGPQTGTQRHLRTTSVTHGPQPRADPLHRSGRSIGDRGLIVGLFWRSLGMAAAVGLAPLLIGSVGSHAPRRRLRRPKATHTSDHSNRALRGIRRRHTRADNVTELTVTLSPVPKALGVSRQAANAVIQQLPTAELVRAQQQHKSGAALEHNVTNQPSTKYPSIRACQP